jgi:hypothetical protein
MDGAPTVVEQKSGSCPSLGSRTALNETFPKTVQLEIAKQIVTASIRLQKMSVTTLFRFWPPLKQKKYHTWNESQRCRNTGHSR